MFLLATVLAVASAKAQLPTQDFKQHRGMWASINNVTDASLGDEQVGYNQPTNIGGYYLGSDMDFSKVPLIDPETTSIQGVTNQLPQVMKYNRYYDLSGRVVERPKAGLYVRNGKKLIVR